MTTTDVLAQALAALDGVTDGPWEWTEGKVPSVRQVREEWANICETWTEADAAFIAWARDGVPELIAEVERLRAQIAAVQALADRIERESQAPGPYSEIRRAHATMIRLALNGE